MPLRGNLDHGAAAIIPGVVSHFPNHHVNTLKRPAWTDVLSLLGREGERLMLDLILDHHVFVAAAGGSGNFYQLSGEFWSSYNALSR